MDSSVLIAAAQTAEQSVAEGSFIGTLGLNWKLFLGQLVNFGIVFFVLWKWVFTPLTRTLEERRRTIEQGLRNAEEYERKVAEIEERKIQDLKETRRETEKILRDSLQRGQEMKEEVLQQARKAAEKIVADAKTASEAERERVAREVHEEMANLIVMAAEKVIQEKLDPKADKKLIDETLRQIRL